MSVCSTARVVHTHRQTATDRQTDDVKTFTPVADEGYKKIKIKHDYKEIKKKT